jgi:hypothetical protein
LIQSDAGARKGNFPEVLKERMYRGAAVIVTAKNQGER